MAELDIDALDNVIHGKIRLWIMAYLSEVNPAGYLELLEKSGATNGNLATHLRKLEAAGYVIQTKSFKGRRPYTEIALTQTGREAWIGYLKALKALIG
ncbi:MAG: winged helix-turn-helix domain-containing protein [Maricaulaceae bacterium]